MKNTLRATLVSVATLLALIGIVLAAFGNPLAFRLVTFGTFAGTLFIIANIGDILASFDAARQRNERAQARLTGEGFLLDRTSENRALRAMTNIVRVAGALNAVSALWFALNGIPTIPGGALLPLAIVGIPTAFLATIACGAIFGTTEEDEVAAAASATERASGQPE